VVDTVVFGVRAERGGYTVRTRSRPQSDENVCRAVAAL
jgi:hypothetical protein